MRVNLLKLIQDLLLPILRRTELIEFIRSLLLILPKAHNDFELFSNNAKYKANANASVISLEHHINREFDVKAKITELDGRPIDFLVTIIGNVDEIRLRALIDSYKLYGRSYVFKVGETKYSTEFINHQCENLIEKYSVEFIEHKCEEDNIVYISAETFPKEHSGAHNEYKFYTKVTCSKPVKSEIRVSIWIPFKDPDGTERAAGVTVWFYPGEKEKDGDVPVYDENIEILGTQVGSINPWYDSYYSYRAKNN